MAALPPPEIQVPFEAVAHTNERKEELLRQFLQSHNIEYDEHNNPVNRNKFLFLFGVENTGKETILKKVAKELFGQNFENRLYIRIDSGQKFPYKLHAHKVESSQKVIFITDNLHYWNKWKELFPRTTAFEFIGQDTSDINYTAVQINREELRQHRHIDLHNLKDNIKNILDQKIQDTTLRNNLQQAIFSELTEFNRSDMLFLLGL